MPLLEDRVSIAVEKILLATDFSLSSEKAAAYAKGMAQRFSSTVEIAHVFDPSVVPSCEEAARGEPVTGRRATVDRLEEIKSEFHNSGILAETALPEGHRPFAALLKIAKERQVDLVVAGTESKLGVERLILGSTAEELIRNAQVPVLTVGPNVRLPKEGPLAFKSIIAGLHRDQ
jgi:nucleotide-binding universal stress UspA family protein